MLQQTPHTRQRPHIRPPTSRGRTQSRRVLYDANTHGVPVTASQHPTKATYLPTYDTTGCGGTQEIERRCMM
jgi:hypothetical protein